MASRTCSIEVVSKRVDGGPPALATAISTVPQRSTAAATSASISLRLRHVGRDGHDFRSGGGGDLPGGVAEARFVARGEHHARSLGGERVGDGAAQPHAAAGHDGHPAADAQIHSFAGAGRDGFREAER
jgi:hypothetical protein